MNTFEELSPKSRLWIYQADRQFEENEVTEIEKSAADFCNNWAAHGQALKAWSAVLHNRFVVFIVDETQTMASGCSIDTSVNYIREISDIFKLDFFDRMLICYKDGEAVKSFKLGELNDHLQGGKINMETPVFNNLIYTKEDFENKWVLPLEQTWMKKKVKTLPV